MKVGWLKRQCEIAQFEWETGFARTVNPSIHVLMGSHWLVIRASIRWSNKQECQIMATKKNTVAKKSHKKIEIPFQYTLMEKIPLFGDWNPVSKVCDPPADFTAECKVESVGMYSWNGVMFVALKALDGQSLPELLQEGQHIMITNLNS